MHNLYQLKAEGGGGGDEKTARTPTTPRHLRASPAAFYGYARGPFGGADGVLFNQNNENHYYAASSASGGDAQPTITTQPIVQKRKLFFSPGK